MLSIAAVQTATSRAECPGVQLLGDGASLQDNLKGYAHPFEILEMYAWGIQAQSLESL